MIGYHGGHVPDISTASGLHKVMALGNLCEAGALVQRENYVRGMSAAALEETVVARRRYRELQMWFAWRYTLEIRGKVVNPFYAFRKSLATFMAALVVYKGKLEKEVPPVEGCSLKVLTKKVKAFLEAEHEELVHIWERYIREKQSTFYCDDMSFSIKKRSITDHLNEVYEDDIDRIYRDADDERILVESEDEEGDVDMEDGAEADDLSLPETSAEGSTNEPRVEKRKVAPGMC